MSEYILTKLSNFSNLERNTPHFGNLRSRFLVLLKFFAYICFSINLISEL